MYTKPSYYYNSRNIYYYFFFSYVKWYIMLAYDFEAVYNIEKTREGSLRYRMKREYSSGIVGEKKKGWLLMDAAI